MTVHGVVHAGLAGLAILALVLLPGEAHAQARARGEFLGGCSPPLGGVLMREKPASADPALLILADDGKDLVEAISHEANDVQATDDSRVRGLSLRDSM